MSQDLIKKYVHLPEEYPVLMQQTHKIIKDKKMVNERININENLIHYVQDTALLISEIDGSLEGKEGLPFDHVIYLDKSARPVSWLVNLFWDDFASSNLDGTKRKRPKHSYINIDRAPWFRNVGIAVNDDGRQKENGELATYTDFIHNIANLKERHLAEIRALYIEGGIETEDVKTVMQSPTILDGKNVLIVDEVSRTGSTLNIAEHLFRLAFPDMACIKGAYFWHPMEPMIKVGTETVITSLPVWYDPSTLTGRGIGGLDPVYYRQRYEYYLGMQDTISNLDIKKMRTQAFSSSVFSAPLLHDDGTVMSLDEEKVTRRLCRDLKKLHADYQEGHLFFLPPSDWRMTKRELYLSSLKSQGVKLLPAGASAEEQNSIKRDPLFFLNFIETLKNS
ncbi:MAG: hypothetical protein J6S31_02120 [Lachnospiraceae bacterium]|nr:hypothetical protein [Lachnospiraceae bacterium]